MGEPPGKRVPKRTPDQILFVEKNETTIAAIATTLHDKNLSKEERRKRLDALFTDSTLALFEKYDTNKDGKFQKHEFIAIARGELPLVDLSESISSKKKARVLLTGEDRLFPRPDS